MLEVPGNSDAALGGAGVEVLLRLWIFSSAWSPYLGKFSC